MNNKAYHHGNLRNALIEAGIKLINQEGRNQLSLRKVALLCNVSHSAPYAHFQSKEELLKVMQDYVTKQLENVLIRIIKGYPDQDNPNLLASIGKEYVMFFIKNPQYFHFLFLKSMIKITLSLEDSEDNFPPYVLFKNHSIRILKKLGFSKNIILDHIISMWATVQGLASLATMPNLHYSEIWENKIIDIISVERRT